MIEPYTELQCEIAFALGYVAAKDPDGVLLDKLTALREALRAGASDRLNVILGDVNWAIGFTDGPLREHLETARDLVIDLQGHGPVEPE